MRPSQQTQTRLLFLIAIIAITITHATSSSNSSSNVTTAPSSLVGGGRSAVGTEEERLVVVRGGGQTQEDNDEEDGDNEYSDNEYSDYSESEMESTSESDRELAEEESREEEDSAVVAADEQKSDSSPSSLLRATTKKSKLKTNAPTNKPAFVVPTSTTTSKGKTNDNANNRNNKTGKEIFQQALKRAIGGGIPGAIAGAIQVLSLMWLRTVINYQYRYGSTFTNALTTLYTTGGIPRLYSGLGFALIQAPLSRFVSTAANDGITVLLHNLPYTSSWGPGRQVIIAAIVVGFFRMLLMPIDTCKTVLQIESIKGFQTLMSNVFGRGHFHLLYSGALANALSSMIGHYPWFYTYNLLQNYESLKYLVPWENLRNALIGFVSSIVSDTVANFMRVIKTTKQALGSTMTRDVEDNGVGGNGRGSSGVTYSEAISVILAVDGWRGLFGRGLKTRILGNALQSILFTVIWRGLAEKWSDKSGDTMSKSDEELEVLEYDETDVELTDGESETD